MTIPNQAPDSSAHGILQPEPRPPAFEGQRLEDWLQQYVAAIAHLDGTLTRPRWQTEPIPNLPDFSTPCWAAIGITRRHPLGTYAWVGPRRTEPEPGQSTWDQGRSRWDRGQSVWDVEEGRAQRARTRMWGAMQRHEELTVLCSFYGPEADEVASLFHSNLMVWQNQAWLRLAEMAFVEVGDTVYVPELVKEQWLERVDKTLTLRRIVRRNYPVLTFLSAGGIVFAHPGGYRVPFSIVTGEGGQSVWDRGASIWDRGRSEWDIPR